MNVIIENSRFLFVRHGQTGKSAIDEDRQLTEAGIEQAGALQKKIRELGYGLFDQVVTSSVVRAVTTATIVGQVENCPVAPPMAKLRSLYERQDLADRDICNEAFGALGYAPLTEYMRRVDYFAIERFGQIGTLAVLDAICRGTTSSIYNQTILVVGHAVVLNAMAISLLEASQSKNFKGFGIVAGTSLSECGALELKWEENLHQPFVTLINQPI